MWISTVSTILCMSLNILSYFISVDQIDNIYSKDLNFLCGFGQVGNTGMPSNILMFIHICAGALLLVLPCRESDKASFCQHGSVDTDTANTEHRHNTRG